MAECRYAYGYAGALKSLAAVGFHSDAACVTAVTVPSSLFGKEVINVPLRQDIVNSLIMSYL